MMKNFLVSLFLMQPFWIHAQQFNWINYEEKQKTSQSCPSRKIDDSGLSHEVHCWDGSQKRIFQVHLSYQPYMGEERSLYELLYWIREPAAQTEQGSSLWVHLKGSSQPTRIQHRQFLDQGRRALELIIQ